MTEQQLIELARECGAYEQAYLESLAKFAQLAVAHEREACAVMLENYDMCGDCGTWNETFAAAVRARSNTNADAT